MRWGHWKEEEDQCENRGEKQPGAQRGRATSKSGGIHPVLECDGSHYHISAQPATTFAS